MTHTETTQSQIPSNRSRGHALRTAGAALAVAAIVAGCSNDEGGAAAGTDTGRDEGVAFAECMREAGVSEFPDPDASGELTIDGVLNGSSLDPSSPTWRAAIAECEDLQPAGFTGDEDLSPEEQEGRLEFAECMRNNGVEDFPDPEEGQPLVDTRRIPSSDTGAGMTILNAAMDTCGELAEEAAGQ